MTTKPDFKQDASRADQRKLTGSSLSSTCVSRPEELSPQSTDCPRKGVIRIICFFLLVGIIAELLNFAINSGLRRITVSKFGSLNQVMAGKVNADIIISGSSRALSHYDPRAIKDLTGMSAYNIGMNASQIDFELVILKCYLKHNIKPKLVIQNLDLFSFETTKPGELYDPGYYMPYLKDNGLYEFFKQVEPDAWKCKYIPLYGYAVEDMRFTWIWGILRLVGIQGPQDYFLGYNPRLGVWSQDFEHFRQEVPNGVHYMIQPQGVNCLEELIELCQRNGIQIILVYSPEYFEMQSLETNRKEIMAKFHNIAEQFKIPFWDYSDSMLSQQRDFFNNSEHLNARGAKLFSTDFAHRLVDELPKLTGKEKANDSATSQPSRRVVQQ